MATSRLTHPAERARWAAAVQVPRDPAEAFIGRLLVDLARETARADAAERALREAWARDAPAPLPVETDAGSSAAPGAVVFDWDFAAAAWVRR